MFRNSPEQLPTMTVTETVAVITEVVLPNLAKGVVKRRPRMVGLSERFNAEAKSVQLLGKLRRRYGKGPVLLKLPLRSHALILNPEDADRVLENSPEPFATATWEKKQALSHFQPRQALVSHGLDRAERRQFNEDILEPDRTCHHLAERFVQVIAEEADDILRQAKDNGHTLDWEVFARGWFNAVRRIVLGDSAREDEELTHMLDSLRRNANWAFLHPRQTSLRKRFKERLRYYLDKGEQGSLAGSIKALPNSSSTEPEEQIPHWLFAFDPAGMAAFRTLALLATHPQQAQLADMELADPASSKASTLPFLRACVLESLRLWPTTPLILRESTRVTHWKRGALWAGSNIIIFTPFFHRDSHHLPAADSFDPGLWTAQGPEPKVPWPVIPFSQGPAMCPGRHVVLLATSHMVGALWKNRVLHLHDPGRLSADEALPATLNNYSLQFAVGEPHSPNSQTTKQTAPRQNKGQQNV